MTSNSIWCFWDCISISPGNLENDSDDDADGDDNDDYDDSVDADDDVGNSVGDDFGDASDTDLNDHDDMDDVSRSYGVEECPDDEEIEHSDNNRGGPNDFDEVSAVDGSKRA